MGLIFPSAEPDLPVKSPTAIVSPWEQYGLEAPGGEVPAVARPKGRAWTGKKPTSTAEGLIETISEEPATQQFTDAALPVSPNPTPWEGFSLEDPFPKAAKGPAPMASAPAPASKTEPEPEKNTKVASVVAKPVGSRYNTPLTNPTDPLSQPEGSTDWEAFRAILRASSGAGSPSVGGASPKNDMQEHLKIIAALTEPERKSRSWDSRLRAALSLMPQ